MSKQHEIVDEIRDESGLVAIITRRKRPDGFHGYGWAIFKEFERRPGGETQRTTYKNDRHIGAARRLLNRIAERIDMEKDKLHAARRETT